MRTSYFAKNGNHYAAVSIAVSTHRGYKGKCYSGQVLVTKGFGQAKRREVR